MKIGRHLLFAVLTVGSATLANAARADVPSPNQSACQGQSPGASCNVLGVSGACQNVSGEGLRCHSPEGGVISDSYATAMCFRLDAGSPCSTNGSSNQDNGTCQMTPYTSFVCVEGAQASDDGGCSLGTSRTTRSVGPWLMAGSVWLLIAFARRRRSRSS
jgi:hypothetical protein